DSSGSFVLQNLVFVDSLKIFYQPNKQKFLEGIVEISFETLNRFYPFTGTWPAATWMTVRRKSTDSLPALVKRAMAQRAHELLLSEKANMMEEVTIRTTKQSLTQELEKQLTTGLFSGGNAMVFDFVNNERTGVAGYTNILEWLQGRVPGFSLEYRNGNRVPMIRNAAVQVYLDEMPIDDELVNTIPPFDIALLKVYRSASGALGGNVIAIYTRRGGMPTNDKVPTLQWNSLKGYKKVPAFPMPTYEKESNRDLGDERIILYRSGMTLPDPATKKVPVIFYNNDSAKSFRLLITGFTQEGRPVYVNRIISAPGR
ncbi:MAG TPA: Plug domain-containing protein, partial [Flavisolibacter sp.]|nr:Plug domain-containing protein [Flavisolibacter sp.]